MKKNIIFKYMLVISALVVASCSSSDDTTDTQKPTVSIQYANGFPKACAEVKRGDSYTFRAQLTDNDALAAYSIDIHHNFDHHTHDDQQGNCNFHADKVAVNDFQFIKNFQINTTDAKSYEIQQRITIPADADTGDYHCQFSVTDKTGWQSITSVDFKIIE
ncbi:MAG: DUF4625 domain-containing protein [Flavobacteriaceae bacterium]|nr:DUF4625 domain-containing protein [Flavobacteriaceae bacterium]